MERIKTYVKGLDELMNGGIPEESVVLVSGGPGTGKTILCLQYLINGIKKGDKGLYITFEEEKDAIYDQAREFGWDLKKLEKEKKLLVRNIEQSETLGQIYDGINKAIDGFNPDRLVIDSLSTFALYAHQIQKITRLEKIPTEESIFYNDKILNIPLEWDGVMLRRLILDLIRAIQSKKITGLLTSEVEENSNIYSKDGVSEFLCDGLIGLKKITIGAQAERTLQLVKMRRTEINAGIFNMKFTKSGIEIEYNNKTK